jgi:hypothetical protein
LESFPLERREVVQCALSGDEGLTLEAALSFMREFVGKRRWQFAKTMPNNPHWYTVRRWEPVAAEVAEFEAFAALVRRFGYDEVFAGRTYRCLDLDEWHYWDMGEPLSALVLINRKYLPMREGRSILPDGTFARGEFL